MYRDNKNQILQSHLGYLLSSVIFPLVVEVVVVLFTES